jgi:hypothetical protein
LALGIIRTKGPNLKKALRDLNQGLNTKWKGSQMTPVKETPEIWEPLIRLQKIISENNC